MRSLTFATILLYILCGCGTWVGNPKPKGDDDDGSKTDTPTIAQTGGGAGSGKQNTLTAKAGDVLVKRVYVKAGTAFETSLGLKSLALADGEAKALPIELSVLNPDGTEAAYARAPSDNAKIAFTPEKDGELIVTVKNNTTVAATVDTPATVGADTDTGFLNADASTSPYKDIALKAVISFGKLCKKMTADGMGVDTVTAPGDSYFVQPFVFLGKVGADKKVAPLATATISIKSGGKVINLTRIEDLPRTTFASDAARGTDADKLDYVRTFYQGYFGAAGQMYTTDTFHLGGDCAQAVAIDLGKKVAEADVQLAIEDATQTPPLSMTYKIRPTESVPFSVRHGDGTKLDYSGCTYGNDGEPVPYMGEPGAVCTQLSQATPPYVMLDYKLPDGDAAPTRILFYGNGQTKAWKKALFDNHDAIAAGTMKEVALPTCFFNGGLVSVPVSATDKIALPLAELNAAQGDVIHLAHKPGSYTALTDFYQGNVDGSGKLSLPTCVPNGAESCPTWARLDVKIEACTMKADSGISVPTVGDNFIYPDYYEMNGVIAP